MEIVGGLCLEGAGGGEAEGVLVELDHETVEGGGGAVLEEQAVEDLAVAAGELSADLQALAGGRRQEDRQGRSAGKIMAESVRSGGRETRADEFGGGRRCFSQRGSGGLVDGDEGVVEADQVSEEVRHGGRSTGGRRRRSSGSAVGALGRGLGVGGGLTAVGEVVVVGSGGGELGAGDEGLGGLVEDGGEGGDVGEELVQERGVELVGVVADHRLLRQNDVLRRLV